MRDLKFAVRQLIKNPGFTAIALFILALGIGANTAIFSVLNTIMLRPLPYPKPDQLVRVFRTSPQSQNFPHSIANFLDYRDQNRSFERLAAFVWSRFGLAEPGQPAETVRGIEVTADFFLALGGRAELGRTFATEEELPGKNSVIVLSHSFWTDHFGADTNLLGRTLRVDGQPVTVIGVMPLSFEYPQLWGVVDAWRPLAFSAEQRQDRINSSLNMIGRLKKGVSIAQSEARMRSTAAYLEQAYPEQNTQNSVRVAPLHDSIGDASSRRFAWLMLCLTGFVLLIACVNLANLQLARAATRSRELAVRLALGARRSRIMSQLLVESLLLSLLGGGAGVILAVRLSQFIGSHLTRWSPTGVSIETDQRVLCFALLCSATTGVLFGVVPAWFASGLNVNTVLKSSARGATSGRSQNRVRYALTIGQVAFALILLTGAGLFITGLQEFIHQPPGWQVEGLLTGWTPLNSSKYISSEARQSFLNRLEQKLNALPGLEGAAISSSFPIWTFGTSRGMLVEGQPRPPLGQEPLVQAEAVSPGYFNTLGIRRRAGRLFSPSDDAAHPDVVIINEAMARQFWPGQSPLGKRLGIPGVTNSNWQLIVGVVNDVHFPANLNRPETLWQLYRPLAQEPRPSLAIALRTSGPPEKFASALRAAVADLDPDLPVNELDSAQNIIQRLLGHFTLAGVFLLSFGMLGLVLAALGIYGVISYCVVQRTVEIGIRMALGAEFRHVLWLVLKKGILLCSIGGIFGLIGALAIARLLAAAVPEVPARGPVAFAGIIASVVVATIAACWLPARRAAKVDPVVALRSE